MIGMKKVILGGLTAAAVALGIAGTATANASTGTDNYTFIQMLNNDQIWVSDLSRVLASAHQVCYNVANNGATGTSETNRIYYSWGTFTPQGAHDFVWDSVTVFCPQFLPGGSQNPIPSTV